MKSVLVLSAVLVAALSFGALSASASFTCVGGASCTATFKSDGTKAAATRASLSIGSTTITCALTASTTTINDGVSSLGFSSLAFTDCQNNAGCSSLTITVQNLASWAMTLSSSTKLGTPANSWPIAFSAGGATIALSGCIFGTSGAITISSQTPVCTPGSFITTPNSVTISCSKISWTATGAPALIIGSSGTSATFTVVVTAVTVPGGGLTIS